MEQTDLRIRAKKISELDQLTESDNISFDKSFIIVGYRDGDVGKNYKIPLSFIFDYIAEHNNGIDENELKDKVQELIDNNNLSFDSVIMHGPQGPQGHQGKGAEFDIAEIQRQIDYLQSLINQYHKEYNIEYNLSYISANITNDTDMLYNETVTLYFEPQLGYVMPDYVTVNGAEFEYNKTLKTVKVFNPNSSNNKIIISMVGNIGYYTISYSLTNIAVSYISAEHNVYQYNEEVEIQLTPNGEYALPNSLNVLNGEIINYDKITGILKFKVSGTGNIIISGAAVLNSTYYFGFAADGVDGESILGYDTNGMPNGQITVNNNFYTNTGCPIDYTVSYKFTEDPTEVYGDDNVWLIVPTKYFNTSRQVFLDDNNNEYRLTGGNSGFNITIETVINGSINGEPYSICLIANEGITDYINFIRK